MVGINAQTTKILKKAESEVELLWVMARLPAKSDMLMCWREYALFPQTCSACLSQMDQRVLSEFVFHVESRFAVG